jgi:hypothetical protein
MTRKEIAEILILAVRVVATAFRELLADFVAYVAWIYKKPVVIVFTALLVGCAGYLVHASNSIPSQLSENGRIVVKVGQFNADFEQLNEISEAIGEYNEVSTSALSYVKGVIDSNTDLFRIQPETLNEARRLLQDARDKGTKCIVQIKASKFQTPTMQDAFKGFDDDFRTNDVLVGRIENFITLLSNPNKEELITFRYEWTRDSRQMEENAQVLGQKAKNISTVFESIQREFKNEFLDGRARGSSILAQIIIAEIGFYYFILYLSVITLAFIRFSHKRGKRRRLLVKNILMKYVEGGITQFP